MPVKRSANEDKAQPLKRQKLAKIEKYESVAAIRASLQSQTPDGLAQALTTLRNQFAVRPQETLVSPQDERIILVKQWMENQQSWRDLLDVWESSHLKTPSLVSLVVSLLSSILSLLCFHYTDYGVGQPIVKHLVTPSTMRRLNSYIGGSNNELIIVTLKLYNVLSNFAGGRERKAVLEGFPWEMKSLPKLFNMRRRGDESVDPLLRPDIRTLYISLLLTFVGVGNTTQIKSTFLEQHRDTFFAIFKGIAQDHYSFVRKVLEICWAGIWSDAKLKRTLKIGLFSEITIGHLLKLYERSTPENDEADHVPANLVHHFLLAICTRPGVGVCFKDRGWYPKEADAEDALDSKELNDDRPRKSGKIYNKILSNVVKTLKVNEDSRQQELALKILASCPELISGYWSSATLTLEPRLSSKWIANIAFFGNVISLPVPSASFHLPDSNSQQYQPSPPPLPTIIENILPSVNTKNNFSKGLQSTSGLVQHCSALTLSKCLLKYQEVHQTFVNISKVLEENEESGQWAKRCRDLEKEVRRRVPEFQVIVAFSQQKFVGVGEAGNNPTKAALLSESAQRLLWLYHRCLPSVVAEARFDVGKLLLTFGQTDSPSGGDAADHLKRVQKLHILNLLRESDQFVLTSKGALSHSPLYILLQTLISSSAHPIRRATSTLLRHALANTILFQDNPDETSLWLSALPSMRPPRSDDLMMVEDEAISFADEAPGVIAFLDDCVQRCLKTPYRYIEELQTFTASDGTSSDGDGGMQISPLIMTVLEQLQAKLGGRHISAVQTLGVVSFIKRLVYSLAGGKVYGRDLSMLRRFAQKVEEVVRKAWLFQGDEMLKEATLLQLEILNRILEFKPFRIVKRGEPRVDVDAFIRSFEASCAGLPEDSKPSMAYQMVDWMRTSCTHTPIGTPSLRKIATQLELLHPSVVSELLEHIVPGEADVWSALDLKSTFSPWLPFVRFAWLYPHSLTHLPDKDSRSTLASTVLSSSSSSTSKADVTSALNLVLHYVVGAGSDMISAGQHLLLLSRVFFMAKEHLSPEAFFSLKERYLGTAGILRDLMMSSTSSEVLQGIQAILQTTLDPVLERDRKLVSDISTSWTVAFRTTSADPSSLTLILRVWIQYLEPADLFSFLSDLNENVTGITQEDKSSLVEATLLTLRTTLIKAPTAERGLKDRIPLLLSLRSSLSNDPVLEEVLAVAIERCVPLGLDGRNILSSTSDVPRILVLLQSATERWPLSSKVLSGTVDVRPFLSQDKLTSPVASILSSLVYLQPNCRDAVWKWLESGVSSQTEDHLLVTVLHALMDSSSADSLRERMSKPFFLNMIPNLVSVIVSTHVSPSYRNLARRCLSIALSLPQWDVAAVVNTFASQLKNVSRERVNLELLFLGVDLAEGGQKGVKRLLEEIVDLGLRWFIGHQTSSEKDEDFVAGTWALAKLVKKEGVSKSHSVETVLTVVIQNQLSNVSALRLAKACISTAQLKPVIVNRHLQSIVQHTQFLKICGSTSPEYKETQEGIISLLHTLFLTHPNNTCQVTHVEPLIRVYRGTLSRTDVAILDIFQLFESQRKLSIAPIFACWTTTLGTSSETALEGLRSLEANTVLRTATAFPRKRTLSNSRTFASTLAETSLYDPVFLILLFSQMLQESAPNSNFAWVELFRTNIISLLIRALSSRDDQLRELALGQIAGLWSYLENADLHEKPHVMYILNMLKALIVDHSAAAPARLPSYATLLFMHALRGIFYPSNFIYPYTARFLLQRPEFDVTDVPMLYGMLYSSSDDWKKERTWMIKFLSDGMMSTADWRVLKRRHTWDLLASLYQSADADASLRHDILEVLTNLTCNQQATTSLLLKSALLPWIELQLLHSTTNGVQWIHILENILVVTEAERIERVGNGEWRSVICRCLQRLLSPASCQNAVAHLRCALPVILRISTLGAPSLFLDALAEEALHRLEDYENTLGDIPSKIHARANEVSLPPHSARGLQLTNDESTSFEVWGSCVEFLWRIAMNIPRNTQLWTKLTQRLLIWRAMGGSNVAKLGEWARKESIRNLNNRGT